MRSKYAKIPVKTKLRFLRKVILEGFSIKDVILIIFQSATIFNINYSTAKTLIRQYKSDAVSFDLHASKEETDFDYDLARKLKRCGYKEIGADFEEKQEHSSQGTHLFYLSGSNKDDNASIQRQS